MAWKYTREVEFVLFETILSFFLISKIIPTSLPWRSYKNEFYINNSMSSVRFNLARINEIVFTYKYKCDTHVIHSSACECIVKKIRGRICISSNTGLEKKNKVNFNYQYFLGNFLCVQHKKAFQFFHSHQFAWVLGVRHLTKRYCTVQLHSSGLTGLLFIISFSLFQL